MNRKKIFNNLHSPQQVYYSAIIPLRNGTGGSHVGMDYIWPMSIAMRGLTSTDDKEIKMCLDMLQKNHAGTGFMHEAFHKDDATKFTRKWFAWLIHYSANLFGKSTWKENIY